MKHDTQIHNRWVSDRARSSLGPARQTLLLLLMLTTVAAGPAWAKREVASGPIVRPLNWHGLNCPLENFGTLRFTATATAARLYFDSLVHLEGCEELPSVPFTWRIRSLAVLPAAVYDANVHQYVAVQDSFECTVPGQTYTRFDPVGVPAAAYVLRETFATGLSGAWNLGPGVAFVPGSGISITYVDDGVPRRTATVGITGLTVGETYAVTFRTLAFGGVCGDLSAVGVMRASVETDPDTWHVARDGSGDFRSIGASLAAAGPGARIVIWPGTYDERRLQLPRAVSVVGATDEATDTVIDAGNDGYVFRLDTTPGDAPVAHLANLTLTRADSAAVIANYSGLAVDNCRFIDNVSPVEGGGINAYGVYGVNTLSVARSLFSGNVSGAAGGAIHANGFDVVVEECEFLDNQSGTSSGAIAAFGQWITVVASRFEGNAAAAGPGGGAYLLAQHGVTVTGTEFRQNHATWHGGGLAAIAGNAGAAVSGGTFVENTADGGGGALSVFTVGPAATSDVTSCRFLRNGGPVLQLDVPTTITGCTFADNAPAGLAALISGPATAAITLDRCLIAGNNTYPMSLPTLAGATCNDIHGNAGGDYVGALAGHLGQNGNLSADPLFCDLAGGDLDLRTDSPCLAANNAAGCDIGSAAIGCAADVPVIVAAADVPGDEGGALALSWYGSALDASGPTPITSYEVYRQAAAKTTVVAAPTPDDDGDRARAQDGWDLVTTVPAQGLGLYAVAIATPCDSTATGGPCASNYLVSGRTADPQVFHDSAPKSGYSVDNLLPGPTTGVQAAFTAAAVALVWQASAAPDLDHYNVYRDAGGGCQGQIGAPVAQVTSPTWTDTQPGGSMFGRCYVVTAVDDAGNQGPASDWALTQVSDVPGAPATLVLEAPSPNPFNPRTTIRFSLPRAGAVDLQILDLRGKRVRTLAQGVLSAGAHAVEWLGHDDDGRAVASGVYLVRLAHQGLAQTRRVALLK